MERRTEVDCAKDNARRLTFLGLNVLNPNLSPDGRKIAFSAGGKREIYHYYHVYIVNVDGTGLQRLTDEPGPNFGNSVSPDGIKLVYISDPTGDDDNYFDIYTVWIDGSNRRRLTFDGAHQPVFSPDGRYIVFSADTGKGQEIFRMESDGGNRLQLTHTATCHTVLAVGVSNGHPIFDPNGEWIYFTSSAHDASRGNSDEVHRVRPDGSEAKRLSFTDGSTSEPILNSDGSLLAYTVWPRKGNDTTAAGIYTMNPDGSGQRQIDECDGFNWLGSFSPDSRWIAFASARHRRSEDVTRCWDLYLIRSDGSELRRLTDNLALDVHPMFSPVGSLLAFVSDRDGNEEIYLMDVAALSL